MGKKSRSVEPPGYPDVRYSSGVLALEARRPRTRSTKFKQESLGDRTGEFPLLVIAEGVVIILSSLAAGLSYHEIFLGIIGSVTSFFGIGVLAAALYCGAMSAVDRTKRLRRLNSFDAFRDVAIVWTYVILFITFLAFSLKFGDQLSRGAMLAFFGVGFVGLASVRATSPHIVKLGSQSPRLNSNRVLLIGAIGHSSVNDLIDEITLAGHCKPRTILIDARCPDSEWDSEFRRTLAAIMQAARVSAPGDICISSSGFSESRLHQIIASMRIVPRAIQLVPDAATQQLLRLPSRAIGRVHSIELQRAPLNSRQRLMKRALDLCISIPVFVFALPLMLVVGVAIKLETRGPTLFRQKRLGLGGEAFEILKFRTMNVAERGRDVRQVTRNDPRVTRVGYWLRKTSLDELPQLMNVIAGHMSLVGPRPHALAHDEFYGRVIPNYEVRQHVLPGITGWAQVNGYRGETAKLELMVQRVEHDIWYAINANFLLDLQILVRTVLEVFRSRNAY